jgi:integrase
VQSEWIGKAPFRCSRTGRGRPAVGGPRTPPRPAVACLAQPRTVRVDTQLPPGERVRRDPKTPTSKRTLPLPRVVAEALAEHIRQFPSAVDGTLFTTRHGRPWDQSHYTARHFNPAITRVNEQAEERRAERKAGRTTDPELPTIPASTTPHALRHHYASVLIHAGESVIAVAERLGHEDATLVLRTYGHLMPDSEDRTRRAVEDAWAVDSDGSQPVPQDQSQA